MNTFEQTHILPVADSEGKSSLSGESACAGGRLSLWPAANANGAGGQGKRAPGQRGAAAVALLVGPSGLRGEPCRLSAATCVPQHECMQKHARSRALPSQPSDDLAAFYSQSGAIIFVALLKPHTPRRAIHPWDHPACCRPC